MAWDAPVSVAEVEMIQRGRPIQAGNPLCRRVAPGSKADRRHHWAPHVTGWSGDVLRFPVARAGSKADGGHHWTPHVAVWSGDVLRFPVARAGLESRGGHHWTP